MLRKIGILEWAWVVSPLRPQIVSSVFTQMLWQLLLEMTLVYLRLRNQLIIEHFLLLNHH